MEIIEQNISQELKHNLQILRDAGLEIDTPFVTKKGVSIDITDILYKNFDNRVVSSLSSKNYVRQYSENSKEQEHQEKNFLESFDMCNGQKCSVSSMQDRLDQLDMKQLGSMLRDNFFNRELLDVATCVVNSAYHTSRSDQLSLSDRTREAFTDLKLMGTESGSGFALQNNFGTNERKMKGALVIKAVRDQSKSVELIHEAFCGLSELNKLRKHIPNFAAVVGHFNCSPPLNSPVDEINPKGKNIASFCNECKKGSDVAYAIYENIQPSIDFSTFVRTCDGESFMKIYFAVLCALHVANEKCDFTHYDLHDENLLLRDCTDERYLKYAKTRKNKDFYVRYELSSDTGDIIPFYVKSSGRIPTIIDYGRSHIKHKGKHYGMQGEDFDFFLRQNIVHNESNVVYDAFKLLGMSLATAYEHNNYKLIGQIGPLLRHFKLSEFSVHHISKNKTGNTEYYMLPLKSDLGTLNNLIDFCVEYSNAMNWDVVSFEKPSNSFVLEPVTSVSSSSILEKIGYNPGIPIPSTIQGLYSILCKYAHVYDSKPGTIYSKEAEKSYLTVSDEFLKNSLDGALDREIAKLSASVVQYTNNAYYESSDSFIELIKAGRSISEELDITKEKIVLQHFPNDIRLYWNNTTLETIKHNIGVISQLSNMLQDITASVVSTDYLVEVYTQIEPIKSKLLLAHVKKLKKFNKYFSNILMSFRDIVPKINESFVLFIKKFQGTMAKEARDKEKYQWYYKIISTLPSLFDKVTHYYNDHPIQ